MENTEGLEDGGFLTTAAVSPSYSASKLNRCFHLSHDGGLPFARLARTRHAIHYRSDDHRMA